MPSLVIFLAAVAVVIVHLRAPLRVSMGVLLGAFFLVPAALVVPGAPGSFSLSSINLWTAVVGLVLRVRRGEVATSSLRPTRALIALAGFVAVAYVVGVAFASPPTVPRRSLDNWLILFNQAVFLWLTTAVVRTLGVRWVMRCAATLVVLIAVVGVGEHYLGTSYARWWYKHQLSTAGVSGNPLELRGPHERVRASADFALQYAWALALFLPTVAALALRAKRIAALAAPGVLTLGIIFSITRSVFAGLAASALILLMSARGDRRVIAVLVGAGALAGLLYLGTSSVRGPYSEASPDSISSRNRRIEIVTSEVADHPWFGLGLDGLFARGITSTDATYLQVYAGTGVVGLGLLGGALATAVATAAAAVRRVRESDVLLAGAVLAGVLSALLAGFAYDSLSGPLSSWSLWLLVALGIGLREEADAELRRGPPPRLRLSPWRGLAPLIGVGAGAVGLALASTHTAVNLRLFVLSPGYQSQNTANDAFVGELIINSTCETARANLATNIRLDCQDLRNVGRTTASVRIEAPSRPELAEAKSRFAEVVAIVHPTTLVASLGEPRSGRSTWARTAPAWAALLAGEAAVLVPPLRRRPRRTFTHPNERVGSRRVGADRISL